MCSGSVFNAAGVPAYLSLWDRYRGDLDPPLYMGVAPTIPIEPNSYSFAHLVTSKYVWILANHQIDSSFPHNRGVNTQTDSQQQQHSAHNAEQRGFSLANLN